MKKDKKTNVAPTNGYNQMQIPSSVTSQSVKSIAPNAGHYPKKNGNKGGRVFAIVLMCVLLVGLSLTAIVIMITNKSEMNQKIVIVTNTIEVEPPVQEFDPGSIVINNKNSAGSVAFQKRADLGLLLLDFKQFFEFAGCSVVISPDNQTIEVASSNEIAKYTVGSNVVDVTTKATNTTRQSSIVTAPYIDSNHIFFNVNDLSFVFSDISINHDSETEIWYINLGIQNVDTAEGQSPEPVGENHPNVDPTATAAPAV